MPRIAMLASRFTIPNAVVCPSPTAMSGAMSHDTIGDQYPLTASPQCPVAYCSAIDM